MPEDVSETTTAVTPQLWGYSLGLGVWSLTPSTPEACGDERDKIIQEYKTYKVVDITTKKAFIPTCADFTKSAHSANYSFDEINTGDYTWALIREPLVVPSTTGYGLDKWVQAIGSIHEITSAYRNPAHNEAIGGRPGSRHQFGDAVDLANNTRSKSEHNLLARAALVAKRDFIEPLTGPCGLGCVHADWRLHSGPYAQ